MSLSQFMTAVNPDVKLCTTYASNETISGIICITTKQKKSIHGRFQKERKKSKLLVSYYLAFLFNKMK